MTYDKNGNIKTLKRKGLQDTQIGSMQIDDLTYVYMSDNSNQLLKVTDSPNGNDAEGFIDANKMDDYTYDVNGNLKTDANKGITNIIYNHLNLPTEITFGMNYVRYLYNAIGQKVEKTVSTMNNSSSQTLAVTDYLGGFQYTKVRTITQSGTTVDPRKSSQFFPTAAGYYNFLNNSYVFNYTDQLGNIRLSYQDINSNGTIDTDEILEENNYYPFGLKHSPSAVVKAQPNYNYKYNGKELQDELGLNLYDYGARFYDPALGRWMNVDPLAEKLPGWSPYNFVRNNPINRIDPDGRTDFLINGEKRTINDGNDNLTVRNVSQRQFNRLERKFENGKTPNYNRLLNKVTQKNGYQVSRVITPSWGYSSEHSVEFTSYGKNNKTPYSKHEHRGFYNFAQGLQDSGSKASMVGYGLTLSVVGAEAGIPLATYGGISSGIGAGLQIGMDLYTGNYEEAGKNTAFAVGGAVINKGVGKYLDKNMTGEGSELG